MTEPQHPVLSELEFDALTELVNLGVSRAALSLREMIGREVLLSVPRVSLMERREAIDSLGKAELSTLVAVHQIFEGDINGRALLIFPEAKSLELVRAVANGTLSLEDIVELEHEALAETGNIILNGCLGTMANMLHRSLSVSLPEVVRGDGARLFEFDKQSDGEDNGLVLFLYINFAMQDRDIRGYIAMLMDLPSLGSLRLLIGDFIDRVMNEDIPLAV